MLAIDAGPGAVVLADRFDGAGVGELRAVGIQHLLRIALGVGAQADQAQVVLKEGIGIGADQLFGQRCRLSQKSPVPVDQRQTVVGAGPYLGGGDDVQHGERGHTLRMV